MKRIVSFLAASLFALAALAADGAIEVDRIVAVVNSDVITRTELRQRVEQVTRQLSRQGTPLPPQTDLVLEGGETLVLSGKAEALTRAEPLLNP